MKKIRLFLEGNSLKIGQEIKIAEGDFLYLNNVMRQKIGDKIHIFNGVDGEFESVILSIAKKSLHLQIIGKISELKKLPNITLAFAPVKNVRIDFIAAKGCELGVRNFQPILTQHTIVDKINLERFKANIKEACEQCERNDFPQIFAPKKLERFLFEDAANDKIFILCDESHHGKKAQKLLPNLHAANKEIVVLVGPEGGFSEEEFAKMRIKKNLYAMSLGPRILRADTAAIAALTLVQEFLGDF